MLASINFYLASFDYSAARIGAVKEPYYEVNKMEAAWLEYYFDYGDLSSFNDEILLYS